MGTPTQLMEQSRYGCDWMGMASNHRRLGFHFVVVAMLSLAVPGARAEPPEPKVASFDVDGLKLSMPFNVFRELYPNAEITEKTAARYCYGEEVKIAPLSRLGGIIRQGDATVHITFDYRVFGQGISTIKRDEAIEFDPSQYTSLRDGLVRRYGPFTGIKYAQKMDPAGLVVGFEWTQQGVAYLSVTIYRDHANISDPIRLSTFLTHSLPGMEKRIADAAYYRDAVQTFREECAR